MCHLTSSSECPIDLHIPTNKLYCAHHHPSPKSMQGTVPTCYHFNSDDLLGTPTDEDIDSLTTEELPTTPHIENNGSPLRRSDSNSPPKRYHSNESPPRFDSGSPQNTSPPTNHHPLPPLPPHPPAPPSSPRLSTKPRAASKGRKPLPPVPHERSTVIDTPSAFPSPLTLTPSLSALSDAYFAGLCVRCGLRIPKSGHMVLADNQHFHPECFTCAACAAPISGPYHERDGLIYCAQHTPPRHTCAVCYTGIHAGRFLSVGDNKFHLDCFKCYLCGLRFGTEHDFYDSPQGRQLCVRCFERAWEMKNKSKIFQR